MSCFVIVGLVLLLLAIPSVASIGGEIDTCRERHSQDVASLQTTTPLLSV